MPMTGHENTARDTYHHGALRETLIQQAFKVLETDGLEALSLRDLAERAGVSKTAPYRHFEDKRSLLLVLASTGFRRLADKLEGVMRPAGDRDQALAVVKDLVRGYVAFGRESPALYKLMMSSFGFALHSEECARQSARSFGCLIQAVADAQAFGWKPGLDQRSVVVALWATVHGWAGLMIENLVPGGLGLSVDEMFDQAVADI